MSLINPVSYKTEIRVTYHDSDKMGHAYYSRYLVWFEIGRTELIRERGISYLQMEEQGIFLPVRDCQVRYHAPAMYDDLICVETTVSKLKKTSMEFTYKIINSEKSHLVAEGMTLHPFVNTDRKVIRIDTSLLNL